MDCMDDGSGWNDICVPILTGIPEVCFNGLDDDCDGTVDNGCRCIPGMTLACDTGLFGICAVGQTTCADDGSDWGPCEIVVGPSSEVCDDGLDNDCDGRVDNGCFCTPGSTTVCVTSLPGVCSAGTATCSDDGTTYGFCVPDTSASAEVCFDGLDNDCDGVVDNGCTCAPASTRSCDTGLFGICAVGQTTCEDDGSGWGPCEIIVSPIPEVCGDGLDNDCDSNVDNGCACTPASTTPCVTGIPGICSDGTATCLDDGTGYGFCIPDFAPVAEVCGDGLDNDCDGVVDNGCVCTPGSTTACMTSRLGICSAGLQTCLDDGSGYGPCVQTAIEFPEVCDDALDSDCDGNVDCEDADCVGDLACVIPPPMCAPGDRKSCTVPLPGICSEGEIVCDSFGAWGPCVPILLPGDISEDCGSFGDEDCDGVSDCSDTADCATDIACLGWGSSKCTPGDSKPCMTGLPGLCAVGVQNCNGSGTWDPCAAVLLPGDLSEDCSSAGDEDCDGASDCSDTDCVADPACTSSPPACVPGDIKACLTGMVGVCATGQQVCNLSGTWDPCTAVFMPGTLSEDCSNGMDDDCDGSTDCSDGDCSADPACTGLTCVPGDIQSCLTGMVGVCATGQQVCNLSGTWDPCTAVFMPGTLSEDCSNGMDDDCDGSTDCSDADCTLDPACTGGGGPCTPGAIRSCGYNSVGECVLGTETCDLSGSWGPCVGAILPVAENCSDGLDNDCDGFTDGLDPDCGGDPCVFPSTRFCGYSAAGECALGTQDCLPGGFWDACVGAVYPTDEICGDGLDQNCNGSADEFCTHATCIWTPICVPGGDCEAVATPDSGTPVMQGWVRGLIGTARSWFPWPSPPCITDVTGEVTCDFYFQTGSQVTFTSYYQESGVDRWHAECNPYTPPCDVSTNLWRNGIMSCVDASMASVAITYVDNPYLSGFNVMITQP